MQIQFDTAISNNKKTTVSGGKNAETGGSPQNGNVSDPAPQKESEKREIAKNFPPSNIVADDYKVIRLVNMPRFSSMSFKKNSHRTPQMPENMEISSEGRIDGGRIHELTRDNAVDEQYSHSQPLIRIGCGRGNRFADVSNDDNEEGQRATCKRRRAASFDDTAHNGGGGATAFILDDLILKGILCVLTEENSQKQTDPGAVNLIIQIFPFFKVSYGLLTDLCLYV